MTYSKLKVLSLIRYPRHVIVGDANSGGAAADLVNLELTEGLISVSPSFGSTGLKIFGFVSQIDEVGGDINLIVACLSGGDKTGFILVVSSF